MRHLLKNNVIIFSNSYRFGRCYQGVSFNWEESYFFFRDADFFLHFLTISDSITPEYTWQLLWINHVGLIFVACFTNSKFGIEAKTEENQEKRIIKGNCNLLDVTRQTLQYSIAWNSFIYSIYVTFHLLTVSVTIMSLLQVSV